MDPLDTNDTTIKDTCDYGFTLNVSPKKYIENVKFGDMDYLKQKAVILTTLTKVLKQNGIFDFEWYFEDTKKGVPHLHGCCSTTKAQMKNVQKQINVWLGFPKVSHKILFDFSETKVNISSWKLYMNKTNPEYAPKYPEDNSDTSSAEDIDFLD